MLRDLASLGFTCAALCLIASRALAQEAEAPPTADIESAAEPEEATPSHGSPMDARADIGLVIGGKVGAGLGKPFSDFGATPVFELELGIAPSLGDAIGHSLEFFLSGQYAQPGLDGSAAEADPRVPGGEPFSYDVTQQMLTLSLGALYRFDLDSDLVMPYGGLGARMYLLKTHAEGEVSGQAFSESKETQTDFGLVLLGGVDIFVGPGALLAELSFGWASLDGYIMRDTNLGALSLAVGYRVVL